MHFNVQLSLSVIIRRLTACIIVKLLRRPLWVTNPTWLVCSPAALTALKRALSDADHTQNCSHETINITSKVPSIHFKE